MRSEKKKNAGCVCELKKDAFKSDDDDYKRVYQVC